LKNETGGQRLFRKGVKRGEKRFLRGTTTPISGGDHKPGGCGTYRWKRNKRRVGIIEHK